MEIHLLSGLLLLISLPNSTKAGKHVLRFTTFCQQDVKGDGQYDTEFDGDQLFYVDPLTYEMVLRLPEFEGQWTPDPGLAQDTYVSLGTCHYNIPRITLGEKYPPETIVSPISVIYPEQKVELGLPNTLLCVVDEFHPPEVVITWSRNGQLVDQSEASQTQYYSNSDFSFRLSSYLDFVPQEGDIYVCSVDHVSLRTPLNKFWEVEVHSDDQAVETAVCVCGVILGLIGVGAGVWFIVKANKSCQA